MHHLPALLRARRFVASCSLAIACNNALVLALASDADPAPVSIRERETSTPGSSQASLADLDKTLGAKGWDIAFPSFGDTLLQDVGDWRSTLASLGIGLIEYNVNRFQVNTLDTPRESPRLNGFFDTKQVYWGEKPSFSDLNVLNLTYDLSRFGVPDGQLQVAGTYAIATYRGFYPDTLGFNTLAYYQTAFDRRVELKLGLIVNQNEFLGQNIGGSYASTGGPANTIITLLGMSVAPVSTWSFRITAHLGSGFYNQAAVMRSLVVNGPTGNPLFDTDAMNPTRLDWNVNTSSYSSRAELGAPGTGELFVDEFGYKREATAHSLYTWIRVGGLYNDSTFHDYTKSVAQGGLTPGAIGSTRDGNAGFYLLGDQQIWHAEPGTPKGAGRGMYAGASVMYARPETTAITQYYEGRLYSKGPFRSRPRDLASLVIFYQVNSPYFVRDLNTLNDSGTFGKGDTYSLTASYLARLRPGVYVNLGLSYTKNPSQASYFGPSTADPSQRREGDALNFQVGLLTAF